MTRGHFYHHGRFYAAAALGVAVYVSFVLLDWLAPLAAAADAFFVFYLCAASFPLLRRATAEHLKARAATEDEGALLVVTITLAIVAVNLVSIFITLNRDHPPTGLTFALIIAAAPLGWFVLHTMSAFHYADLHYFDPPGDAGPGQALVFPGTKDPDLWDFFYFSFVIGMTAQVSDVQICTTDMRRAVTGHSIASFFFNTVLIALVVNAVATGR